MAASILERVLSNRLHARSPIGVDFAADCVSWVQLDRTKRGLRVAEACSIPHGGDLDALFSSPTELSSMVRNVLRRGRFHGRKVVTHAPTTDLRLMVLNYAEEPGQSAEAQILELARERMQDDLTHHVVDYVPIRTSGDRQGDRSAMVAVIPEEPVIERLEQLRCAGLDVIALEIAPIAVRRLVVGGLLARGVSAPDEIELVIRVQESKTEVTVVSGRRLLLYREIEVGRDSIVAAIAKNLDCEVEAALELLTSFGVGEYAEDEGARLEFASEAKDFEGAPGIANSLREIARPELKVLTEQAHKAISYAAFQTHGMAIDAVHLMQSGDECPGLDGLLSEMLQLPVVPVDAMGWIAPAEHLGAASMNHRLMLAIGFALRGAIDE